MPEINRYTIEPYKDEVGANSDADPLTVKELAEKQSEQLNELNTLEEQYKELKKDDKNTKLPSTEVHVLISVRKKLFDRAIELLKDGATLKVKKLAGRILVDKAYEL